MKINKIKYSKGIVEINYNSIRNNIDSEYSIRSKEEPLQSFIKAIDDCKPIFKRILEITDKTDASIVIHTLSFQYHEKQENVSIIISGNILLSESPGSYNVNTPLRYYSGENIDTILETKEVNLLNGLCDEAEKYIQGERNQMKLFPQETAA